MTRADRVWLAFHGAGMAGTTLFGWWVEYWIAFAVLEALGLLLRIPYTATVRAFLERREYGAGGLWRDGVVVVWCVWLVGTFWLHAPWPEEVVGPLGLGFSIWIVAHLLGDRW